MATAPQATDLVLPTPADFNGIAVLQALAFQEKQGCESRADAEKRTRKAYHTYHQQHKQKLEHCRIIKSENGMVIAGCQLQVKGDPGDLSFPESMRHKLQEGEVYLEWIACHPDHTGKGLGSKLLRWADSYARETVQARILTLGVMRKNKGAVSLYERKGFVIKDDPHAGDCCDKMFESVFIFCCMGCTYCTLLYMEKDLTKTDGDDSALPPSKEGMER